MISGNMLRDMMISGAHHIVNVKEPVNALNVFPVPDGDTGTNMSMTMTSAANAMAQCEGLSAGDVAGKAAAALLKGARGNSGVILSLLFRGFSKGLAGVIEANGKDVAASFTAGVQAAYKAVMKPTEGTILTVARVAAEKTEEYATSHEDDPKEVFRYYIEKANETLAQTPEMLPVLKQANVVDAGGKGFVVILEGMYHVLEKGEIIALSESEAQTPQTVDFADFNKFDTDEIVFAYCTEYIVKKEVQKKKREVSDLRAYLESIGDCVVAVEDDEIIKVHVHTNHPGRAIEEALRYGSLINMKIENMKEQHEQNKAAEENVPNKPYGFVAVAAGDGIAAMFRDIGVDEVVSGGQTMNPSTDDLMTAVNKVHADTVFILPNNKNIIMAAEQCAELCEDGKIRVIPSRTIPQGISAMLGYNPEASADENQDAMNESMAAVKTAHVTYAARDSVFDDKEIKQGQLLGLVETKVSFVEDDMKMVVEKLIDTIKDEDTYYISLFYGEDVTAEAAEEVRAMVETMVPDAEVVAMQGGQPVYHYIISVE